MAGYVVASYRITNPEAYTAYVPAVIPILKAHGAEILCADYDSEAVEGPAPKVTIVLKFPSKEAARAWYQSPEYQDILGLRTDNSEGILVLTNGFVMP